MPVDLDNSSTVSGEASVSSTGNQNPPPKSAVKKKRNLPGMPDPDAEVIALSPKALLATNRFVCEICNKGFQRDQNLQLHRRGHNLPWKLRQRSSKEVKKKVYVCPEPTCVHHEPSRALGDLTGIKKHFCRKHGEKKWKCEKCSKKYAVQSDWKAHSKICGTKEYKCDCGTLFSRRDSFITHRAFCDALAEESARNRNHSKKQNPEMGIRETVDSDPKTPATSQSSPPPYPHPHPPPAAAPAPASVPVGTVAQVDAKPAEIISSSALSIRRSESPEISPEVIEEIPRTILNMNSNSNTASTPSTNLSDNNGVFAGLFVSSTASPSLYSTTSTASPCLFAQSTSVEPISLCLSTNHGSPLFGSALQDPAQFPNPPPQPAMSATALLQKAAQMGASGGSLLRGLGIVPSTSSTMDLSSQDMSLAPGLGLGLPCGGGSSGSGLKELMMGNSSVFGPKQTTLDFLGLGRAVGGGGSHGGGLSALITSIGSGGLDLTGSFGGGEFPGKDISRSS
ncbi:PREDICTED: protein indeterminate-domain 1-like isoform X2 [Tarenaya hassleriana]|uniref:protein indeterminate-domain 1-like isoform X2 n=1 Tax=Tarenaya hassleriana TaxID=28532 RepID=UPI00053C8982|nr:PREDICTED: protein indeterminate-domain 1-like isoform X2 [Tarenaya hassleriana]